MEHLEQEEEEDEGLSAAKYMVPVLEKCEKNWEESNPVCKAGNCLSARYDSKEGHSRPKESTNVYVYA